MKPITRQIAIGGLLVLAAAALYFGFKSNGEASVFIGIVDSVVIGILALMQGKDSSPET